MAGEKSEDEMLTAQQEMGRVMKGTLDRIIQEIDKRFIRLLDLDDKFGFLLDVEKLCYAEVSDYDLQKKCANLGEVYISDINVKELYEEIIDCRMLLLARKPISKPEELLLFIVQSA